MLGLSLVLHGTMSWDAFFATGLQRWRGVRAVLAWEEAWSSRIGSCFKRSVFYVARPGESRGTYVPSLP